MGCSPFSRFQAAWKRWRAWANAALDSAVQAPASWKACASSSMTAGLPLCRVLLTLPRVSAGCFDQQRRVYVLELHRTARSWAALC